MTTQTQSTRRHGRFDRGFAGVIIWNFWLKRCWRPLVDSVKRRLATRQAKRLPTPEAMEALRAKFAKPTKGKV